MRKTIVVLLLTKNPFSFYGDEVLLADFCHEDQPTMQDILERTNMYTNIRAFFIPK